MFSVIDMCYETTFFRPFEQSLKTGLAVFYFMTRTQQNRMYILLSDYLIQFLLPANELKVSFDVF